MLALPIEDVEFVLEDEKEEVDVADRTKSGLMTWLLSDGGGDEDTDEERSVLLETIEDICLVGGEVSC